jgi:hemerythrin-like metal-binding protein
MAFFTWKNSFCIGIKELDEQHRSLLECLNDCHTQVSNDKRAVIDADLLTRLKAYAAEHFHVEEETMRLFGYTGMGPQEQQHRYFMSQIAELETALAQDRATSVQSVLAFLRDWFLEHILSQDKKFAADVLAMKEDKGDGPLRG